MGVLCLDFVDDTGGVQSPYPVLGKCHFSGGSQQWTWMNDVSFIYSILSHGAILLYMFIYHMGCTMY
jgi:hypothetical protein